MSSIIPTPMGLETLGGREPVAFNQAWDKSPNEDRIEKIGKLGLHSFYGFKKGRERE